MFQCSCHQSLNYRKVSFSLTITTCNGCFSDTPGFTKGSSTFPDARCFNSCNYTIFVSQPKMLKLKKNKEEEETILKRTEGRKFNKKNCRRRKNIMRISSILSTTQKHVICLAALEPKSGNWLAQNHTLCLPNFADLNVRNGFLKHMNKPAIRNLNPSSNQTVPSTFAFNKKCSKHPHLLTNRHFL